MSTNVALDAGSLVPSGRIEIVWEPALRPPLEKTVAPVTVVAE
jgi:hypothetical protein